MASKGFKNKKNKNRPNRASPRLTDGRDEGGRERVVGKAKQDAGFPHAGVADQQQLEQQVVCFLRHFLFCFFPLSRLGSAAALAVIELVACCYCLARVCVLERFDYALSYGSVDRAAGWWWWDFWFLLLVLHFNRGRLTSKQGPMRSTTSTGSAALSVPSLVRWFLPGVVPFLCSPVLGLYWHWGGFTRHPFAFDRCKEVYEKLVTLSQGLVYEAEL